MSGQERKYPIEGICTVCGEPIFVYKSKAKQTEYLTNTKKYNDFHKCYEASWLPKGEIEHEEDKSESKVIQIYDEVAVPKKEQLIDPPIPIPNDFAKARLEKQAKEDGISYEQAKELYGIDFETADVTLEYDRNFRTIQFTVSKAKKCGQVTIPNLPEYESRDFFVSKTIAVDNPSVDITDKIHQTFAEIDARIQEQIRKASWPEEVK